MVEAVFVVPQFKSIIRLIYIYIFIFIFLLPKLKENTRSQERRMSETESNFPFKNRTARAPLDFSF